MAEGESTSSWSIRSLLDKTKKFMDDIGFPQMERPEGFGKSYVYPSNTRKLTGDDLGTLSLQISGWVSYAYYILGEEEAELTAFQNVYDIKLWAAVAEIRTSGKETKEELKGKILLEDEEFAKLTQALMLRNAKVTKLKAQIKIYEEQLNRLSREQSRRQSEERAFR